MTHPAQNDPATPAERQPQELLDEISVILRSRGIEYPVADREGFVRQMCRTPAPVTFAGTSYDTEFAANLVPDFLFPMESEADMVQKVRELLVSRGLLPLSSLPEEP